MLKEIYQLLKCEPSNYKNKAGEVKTSYDISLLTGKGEVLSTKATKEVYEKVKTLQAPNVRGRIAVELSPFRMRAVSSGGKEYTAEIVKVRVTNWESTKDLN